MTDTEFKLDSNQQIYLQTEVTRAQALTFDVKYPELQARNFLPQRRRGKVGDNFLYYSTSDYVGEATYMTDRSTDPGSVGLLEDDANQRIRYINSSATFGFLEMAHAKNNKYQLSQRKVNAVRSVIERKLDELASFGDTAKDLKGFIRFPGITTTVSPAAWSAMTPLAIIAQITGMITAMEVGTNGLGTPDTLILPVAAYMYIAQTPAFADSAVSILDSLQTLAGVPLTVSKWRRLDAGNPAGQSRAILYRRHEDVVALEIVKDITWFKAEVGNVETKIRAYAATAGVVSEIPAGIQYLDSI